MFGCPWVSRPFRACLASGAVVLALTAILVGGCGDDDDDTAGPGDVGASIPAEWAGSWSIRTIERACGSSEVVSDETETETLCAGEPISFGEDEDPSEIDCEGTITDTTIDVTCTSTATFEGSTVVATFELDATRSGDSFIATGHFTATVDGELVECGDAEITATRIGPPVGCGGGGGASFLQERARRTAERFLGGR
jgi:hypothetical protein